MPYPNEHSCRLKEPGQFVRFFRKHVKDNNDIPEENYKATGKPYDMIIGYRKDGSSDPQANRYPKDKWTPEEARKHCKAHKGIRFEPASDGEGSNLITENGCCGADDYSGSDDYVQIEIPIEEAEEIPSIDPQRASQHFELLNAFVKMPWAILPEKLAVLEKILARHINGDKLDAEEVQLAIHGAKRPDNRKEGKIAILPLFGTIFPRANLMTSMSGATSAEIFGQQFDELVKDPAVSAIVLDVDSPGGYTLGIEELSRKIYEARGKKPIVAQANHTMASAAYWVASAADEIVVSPSGGVGSIGVWAAHDDESGAWSQRGVKRTLISAGKYKMEGNPWEPLSEEARAAIQEGVDESYAIFTKDVARNRGVKVTEVRNGFGEGRMVDARPALELGMVDRIGTLEETVKRLQRELFKLSDEERQQAEDLRIKVSQILKKEKKE